MLTKTSDAEPVIVRLTQNRDPSSTDNLAYLVQKDEKNIPLGFDTYVVPDHCTETLPSLNNDKRVTYELPQSLSYLHEGDVIRINPRGGEISVIYRHHSPSNSLFLTEQCNSRCVMCSQPPKIQPDSELAEACLEAIPLIDPETEELGLTGGEPTLLDEKFFEILDACKRHLPNTAIHVLSNGRLFNYLSYAQKLAEIDHPDCVIGIPIYSDLAWEHDFCVQATGAYDQTIRGILNLARCGIRIELRVVIHSYSATRLLYLAEFITRNLPFVEHVALMGLEPIGFGKTNLDALWIDPVDYQADLEIAVSRLVEAGMNASIYNHQLCILPTHLWPFARQSISDWKNVYLPECEKCAFQDRCGGFFHSSMRKYSKSIKPIETVLPEHEIIL